MPTATSTIDLTILQTLIWPTPEVTGPIDGIWTVICEDEVTQEALDVYIANAGKTNDMEASRLARKLKIAGAKTRAREIAVLTQTPAARGVAVWTQPQRVAILNAINDMALMLSWLADDLLGELDLPD